MIVRNCHPREEDTCPALPRPRFSHGAVHVCVTSVGLDDLTRRQQRDRVQVLRVLHQHGRFSVFEATANTFIAKTMDALVKGRLIEVDNSPGYPWSNVKLTAAGLALIEPVGTKRDEERTST